jgi:hypothetical protein
VSLAANRVKLAELLSTALEDVPVTIDPREIHPPCVLVGAPTGLEPAACGLAGVVPVLVIAAGPGNADALEVLLPLVEEVCAVIDMAGPATTTTYYVETSGETGLAAYTVDAILNS